jgi:hypothetical protein
MQQFFNVFNKFINESADGILPWSAGGRNVTVAEYSFFNITKEYTAPAVHAIKKLAINSHRFLYKYA